MARANKYTGGCISVRHHQIRTGVPKTGTLIKFDQNESHIEAIVERNGINYQIDMHLKKIAPKALRSIRCLSGKQANYLES